MYAFTQDLNTKDEMQPTTRNCLTGERQSPTMVRVSCAVLYKLGAKHDEQATTHSNKPTTAGENC